MASGHGQELDQDTTRLVSSLACDMVIQTGVLKQYGKINDAVNDLVAQKVKLSQEKQGDPSFKFMEDNSICSFFSYMR